MDKQINSKNNIFWGDSKPDLVEIKSLHSKKVTVWCALSSSGIIGPYFFEENGKPLTINTERYFEGPRSVLAAAKEGFSSKVQVYVVPARWGNSLYIRYQPPVAQRAVQELRQSQFHDSMAAPFSGPEPT